MRSPWIGMSLGLSERARSQANNYVVEPPIKEVHVSIRVSSRTSMRKLVTLPFPSRDWCVIFENALGVQRGHHSSPLDLVLVVPLSCSSFCAGSRHEVVVLAPHEPTHPGFFLLLFIFSYLAELGENLLTL